MLQSPELQQYSVDSAAAEIEAILGGALHRLGNPPVVRPCECPCCLCAWPAAASTCYAAWPLHEGRILSRRLTLVASCAIK